MFYFLLDTARVNAYVLWKQSYPNDKGHRLAEQFLQELIHQLLYGIPLEQHLLQARSQTFCKGPNCQTKPRKVLQEINPNANPSSYRRRARQTIWECCICKVPLCASDTCWQDYHEARERLSGKQEVAVGRSTRSVTKSRAISVIKLPTKRKAQEME